MELSSNGGEPIALSNGEQRTFLQDDVITLRAHCHAPGCRRIGFGECRGMVLPALAPLGA